MAKKGQPCRRPENSRFVRTEGFRRARPRIDRSSRFTARISDHAEKTVSPANLAGESDALVRDPRFARYAAGPSGRSGPLKTTSRPPRQGPETLDRGFCSLDCGKPALYVKQPGKVPLARLLAKRALRLFQLLI